MRVVIVNNNNNNNEQMVLITQGRGGSLIKITKIATTCNTVIHEKPLISFIHSHNIDGAMIVTVITLCTGVSLSDVGFMGIRIFYIL